MVSVEHQLFAYALLELTIMSPRARTISRFLKGSPILPTSNTCVIDLQNRTKEEPKLFSTLGQHKNCVWGGRNEALFSSLILFVKQTSDDERNKAMHVHIGDNDYEKTLTYIKIKHVGT